MTAQAITPPDVPAPPAGVPADVWGLYGVAEDYVTSAEPLRPEQVEQALRLLNIRIQRAGPVIARLDDEHKAARRLQSEDRARAYLDHDGPQGEKLEAARLAELPAREVADIAQVKLDHARTLLRALEYEVRVFQSVGASVRAAYALPQGDGWNP